MRCGSRLQRQHWEPHTRVVAGRVGKVRSSARRRHRCLGEFWGVPSSCLPVPQPLPLRSLGSMNAAAR